MPDLEVKSANNERYERYKIDSSVYRIFYLFIWFQLYWFWVTYICMVGEKTEENETEACFKTNCSKKKEVISDRYYHQLLLNPVLL